VKHDKHEAITVELDEAKI